MSNTTKDVFDTVKMYEDGSLTKDVYTTRDVIVAPDLVSACGQTERHSIENFLKRPVILKQGTWDSTATEGTELWSAEFPQALLADLYTQNVMKVRGFVGMRARIRVRIQFNSQPFQQGAAILSFYPKADYQPSHAAWFYNR